jgi:hypothetical protein
MTTVGCAKGYYHKGYFSYGSTDLQVSRSRGEAKSNGLAFANLTRPRYSKPEYWKAVGRTSTRLRRTALYQDAGGFPYESCWTATSNLKVLLVIQRTLSAEVV